MNTENSINRKQLRNTLLANGYTPLPLLSSGKGLYIKGWSRQEVTEAWLEQYARRTDYSNTGIRCDQLAAFDLDILDELLCDAAELLVEDHCGETELCRYGRAPKRLLVYRMSGKPPFKSLRTAKYGPHRAELLCGSGRQFAAFGIHPDTAKPYTWDGLSPLELAYKKLPKVDYATAQSCLNALDELLLETGLAIESPGLAFGHAGRQEFDLIDDYECLIDGVVTPWGELKGTLDKDGVFGNVTREDGTFGDSSAVHFMLAAGSDLPCIHDFVRDCTHWDQTITPELAAALPDHAPVTVFTPDPLADLLENWVYVRDKTVRHVNHPMEPCSLDGFEKSMQACTVPNPSNMAKTIPATKAWLRDPAALLAHCVELRPDQPDEILVKRGDITILNTYAPPEHPERGGEAETAMEFIEHLIPNPIERQQFIDWHAIKVAHPSYRMHGLVLVTRAYGTGRGVWFQILAKLFGPEYVCPIVLSDLIGGNSQSAYNEYLADSLILTVAEAFEEKEDTSRWTVRHSAYEKLKVLIEPAAGPVRVKRKYGGILKAMCYASTEIATNHTDALAIEPGDRRLIVLDCTDVPLWEADSDLKNRVVDWMQDGANIGALQRWLAERATETHYNPFDMPIMTPAKERMIEAGQSDTDAAYDYMLENADGDLVTIEQFGAFARRARVDLGLDLPMSADAVKRALTAVLQKRAKKISGLPKCGIKVGGKVPVRPWIIRDFEQWKSSTNHSRIKAEILRNGTPGDNVMDLFSGKPLK